MLRGRAAWLQVWFKNRRAKCRQQQKAAEQVNKTHHHHPRPNSASSLSNASVTGGGGGGAVRLPVVGAVRLPVVGAALDGDDGGAVKSSAVANDDDVDDDHRLIYRHHGGGGLLAAASTARPSCGWVPASLLRQSSDTFAGPYRVGPRLHSAPGYPSAAAMFASRSAGYPGSPYGSGPDLGGYGSGGWSVSVTQEAAYCNGAAGHDACVQFLGPTSTSYGCAAAAVPLFLSSPYDHDHHHEQQHHVQHYHQPHQQKQQQQQQQQKQKQQQLDDDELDDGVGEYETQTSRRVAVQSADDKDWIKYQPL